MVLQGTQVVKPVNVNAFLTKIGARQHTDGVIHGLAFEFSDGSKVNLSAHGGFNTNPYEARATSSIYTKYLDFPNGCDRLTFGSTNTNYDANATIKHITKNITGYKNKMKLA